MLKKPKENSNRRMLGKYVINSDRIDGHQLIMNKFPSLTKRQEWQLYEIMSKQKLSIEDVKKVTMKFPMADIGDRFGFELILNK